jgi:hypothetical protein
VVEVLPGCGTAVIAGEHPDVMVNRGTDGIHFDALRLGQGVICVVANRGNRVLHAHQQTTSMMVPGTDVATVVPNPGSRTFDV